MARTFLSALATPKPLNILHYSFLDEEDPYIGWTPDFQHLDADAITSKISATRWRLNGRYKGLLEPSPDEDLRDVTVNFLHRTVKDFLVMPQMKAFLEERALPDFNPLKSVVGVLLAEAKFLYPTFELQHLTRALECTEFCQQTKFELIDHIETLCEFRYSDLMHPSMHPSLMLRAAVHFHQTDYI